MTCADPRAELRQQALQARRDFCSGTGLTVASHRLADHLVQTLDQLEPLSLGCYWALPGEFNALEALAVAKDARNRPDWMNQLSLALPHARKAGRQMEFRGWQDGEPMVTDECGIPASTGPVLVPEVVLVPCVAYTRSGYRLGYGGGYYDRWLAAHPGVTAVGLAWHVNELSDAVLKVQPHDHPLACIITDQGVFAD
jgi:5,10-methenyltetrahydrofolate synthetase